SPNSCTRRAVTKFPSVTRSALAPRLPLPLSWRKSPNTSRLTSWRCTATIPTDKRCRTFSWACRFPTKFLLPYLRRKWKYWNRPKIENRNEAS
ncbi:unnamed protein product, partial [Nesidiocoris tenuis]